MEIKRIPITEFREKGYLQELNRLFLHPLGLALEVIIDDNGNEHLGGVWDCREDEQGCIYNLKDRSEEEIERIRIKRDFIKNETLQRYASRIHILGFIHEPIPQKDNK
jgi:hypothetical protein